MLWIERTLAFEVLPTLYREVRHAPLKRGVAEHLEQTKAHVERVEQAFRSLAVEPSSNRSAALDAMRGQHEELAAKIVEEQLADLFHATAAARVEQHEVAAYTALIELLDAVEEERAARLLRENRKDEERTLRELEAIAGRLAERVTA